MSRNIWIGIILAVIVIAGIYWYQTRSISPVTPAQEAQQPVGIANPASTNCVNLGGTLEIKDEVNGQAGYCHMKDGRVCEEWALFRDGSCKAPQQ